MIVRETIMEGGNYISLRFISDTGRQVQIKEDIENKTKLLQIDGTQWEILEKVDKEKYDFIYTEEIELEDRTIITNKGIFFMKRIGMNIINSNVILNN